MKYKTIASLLALCVATWAQTATTKQANTAPTEKTRCVGCDQTSAAGAKDGQSCARHMTQSADARQTASCGGPKHGKSCCRKDAQCMKGDQPCCSDCSNDKTACSCCGSKCGEKCGKGCCGGKRETASIGGYNLLQSYSTPPSDSGLVR
jgi:hypothetical protein